MSKKDKSRALAHIEKIEWIKDIDGADNIVLAGVLGWEVICKRNEFKVGEKCVYIEIDSLCPAKDERFEFLANKKFKVKTMKLNKFNVFSQGLALPVTMFPEVAGKDIGTDVTKDLNITYYSEEDRNRKSNKPKQDSKYNSMFSRMKSKHPKFFKSKLNKYLMKKKWGKKLLFVFFGKKKDKPLSMPNFIIKTDETRCLHCDTRIMTDKGSLRISDIVNKKLDVNVLSYNENSGILEYKKIKDYQKYTSKEDWYKFTFPILNYCNKQNTIKCSKDHRFYTKDGQYIEAELLKEGDIIYTTSNCYTNSNINDILGMIIGDSSVNIEKRKSKLFNKNPRGISICFVNGYKQINYLKEKIRLLGGDSNRIIESKSGYCDNKIYSWKLNVDANITNTLYNLGCIQNNRFVITKEFCDRVSVAGLAYWYLDDGCIRHNNLDSYSPSIQIATNSETKEEVSLLIDMLKNRFNIECNIRKDKGKYYSIYITTGGTRKFLELITPYIPLCMRYKTLSEFKDVEYKYKDTVFERDNILIETKISKVEVISIQKKYSKGHSLYDLEIEDNHNFFADSILTHNCENIPQILDGNNTWLVTEKLDGTSATYYINRKSPRSKHFEFGVCSRNIRQKSPAQADYHMQTSGAKTNSYWDIAFKYNIEDILKNYATRNGVKTLVLQGEIIGENIQKNPYKIKGIDFYAFNLYIDGERIGTEELELFCKEYHLNCVPIVDYRHKLPKTMEEMKLEADGFSRLNNAVKREGFVYRSLDGKQSFKNVSREYLLKHS